MEQINVLAEIVRYRKANFDRVDGLYRQFVDKAKAKNVTVIFIINFQNQNAKKQLD